MGIYDREYYRDATRGSGFLSGAAPACKMLIGINVAVFLALWLSPRDQQHLWMKYLAVHSRDVFGKGWIWQLLTSSFLHSMDNVFHIVFNMVFLWFVGSEMESMYGRREFVAMYLTAAVFSALFWAAIDYFIFKGEVPAVGASGAVMAVVVLYALYYPRREMLVFGIVPVQMWLLLVLYVGRDLLNLVQEIHFSNQPMHGFGRHEGPQTAFAAHVGGALYGYLYKQFDLRWNRLLAARSRPPRLRVVTPEPRDKVTPLPTGPVRSTSAGVPRPAPAPVFPEEQLDARLDEVLIKIASQGREGLTEEENRILQEASRRARSKRSDHP